MQEFVKEKEAEFKAADAALRAELAMSAEQAVAAQEGAHSAEQRAESITIKAARGKAAIVAEMR